MKNPKILSAIFIGMIIGLFFYFDLGAYFKLEFIQENKERFTDFYNENPSTTIFAYIFVYIIVTALSLPGATIMTLLGGALFGVLQGTLFVSIASTCGATLAFLFARYLFRDAIMKKFSNKFKTINDGIDKEGGFYLFTMRLVPAFPFFMINLVMGLTNIKTRTFFFVSQIGMLPGTVVYVNAGQEISKISSLSDLANPRLIAAFAILGVLPLALKKLTNFVKKHRS